MTIHDSKKMWSSLRILVLSSMPMSYTIGNDDVAQTLDRRVISSFLQGHHIKIWFKMPIVCESKRIPNHVSVADPNQGSSAFLDPWIRDKFFRIPDLTHISESLITIFCVKIP
jgi:hypothetical protein